MERDCEECGGSGTITTIVHSRGEPIDADLVEVECPDCDGMGVIED